MLANAGMNLAGTVVGGLMADDPYNVNRAWAESAFTPSAEFGEQGEAARGRIGAVTNPYATGALWDQEWMRQEQERRLDDLRARAAGERSVAREQASAMQDDMRSMMRGTGRGGGRFDRADLRTEAFKQEAMLPSSMWSDTEAQARQERNQAQGALFNYQQQQEEQNRQALSNWSTLQDLENKRNQAGDKTGADYSALASFASKWRQGGAVKHEGNESQY
jgi:hypothetical protein